ncbi:MAG: UDP-N-acetylmuramate--L-alanine ligase [Actinomycetaceae bacterium]|nr:UDP-N-acetylmuramate--L-alanine ligase [Actinomycetaceae bacterium]MDY5853929.1 UDP-N-acetylmuramate--L-alanine ligase [Arcanobacterium sp.]
MKFHLIGIGGSGMSVVAELLLGEGHVVTGSDQEATTTTQELARAGADVFLGHSAENVPADAVVVVSSAIKETNPELAIARSRGQQIIHRSQALALAAGDRTFVAVAGTHGKTTTSAMIALALEELGRSPSRAIGGSLVGGLPGGKVGTGDVFVAEADESDASFLNYSPQVAVVTNVEADHLDHYGTEENLQQAFVDFTQRIKPEGLLVACADDPGALALAKQAAANGIRVCTYGRGSDPELGYRSRTAGSGRVTALATGRTDRAPRHVTVRDVLPCSPDALAGMEVSTVGEPEAVQIDLMIPGEHMVLNAAAAWTVGRELGESGADMALALSKFRGAQRRFEVLGSAAGVRVVDDYGHHPTEVAATIATARAVTQGAVHVLFQPLTYARTKIFAADFARELSRADSVVVTQVYSNRDTLADGAQGTAITDLMAYTPFVADVREAAQLLLKDVHAGDIVITLGPKVRSLGYFMLDMLREREGHPRGQNGQDGYDEPDGQQDEPDGENCLDGQNRLDGQPHDSRQCNDGGQLHDSRQCNDDQARAQRGHQCKPDAPLSSENVGENDLLRTGNEQAHEVNEALHQGDQQ